MDNLLLIDKPPGFTSHDAVNVIRKHFQTKKVGHAGTLDPFATGLLLIGVGSTTKQLGALSGLPKTYEATARLGATSTTFDPEGDVTINAECKELNTEVIERVFDQFRKGYEQKAPIYSAKKIKGKKLYEMARRGEATEEDRPSKFVEITKLKIITFNPGHKTQDAGSPSLPSLKFRVTCGSGTYIRSLADDIGHALGCGAYLTALRRTEIGPYRIEKAIPLEKFR
ncbi:MAG: tRNA pseudouridine(55) synthase TruB [bacterium]|nr:tRNA pseudouridine(55) synthase TruB [bacterium]